MRRVEFFDTTLRDGEQSPGVALNIKEKLQIARQLEKLGVDIIEAGFPITSPGDFEAVGLIAEKVRNTTIAALARANSGDIERAWEAIKKAESPRIHTFIATSPIHMKYKLKKSPEEVIEQAKFAVELAKSKVSDVEFSAEDASRSDVDFLARIFSVAIKAGATVLNIPDTVGYAMPDEFARFVKNIMDKTEGIEKVKVSVHCHNDLGLAVANSLAAVRVGVHQVECAVNGLGERAGNAALEEVAMSLHTRKDLFGVETGIVTREIARTSSMVSPLSSFSLLRTEKTRSTSFGMRPMEISSTRSIFGPDTRALAMASCCCSPPDRVCPACHLLSFRTGKRSKTSPNASSTLILPERP